jgi:nitrate/nitrite transporter NarK
MRNIFTRLFLWGGIGLAAFSFFLAIPPEDFGSSPRIPFAAVMFIIGVMTAFLSAVVFEVIPQKRRRQ